MTTQMSKLRHYDHSKIVIIINFVCFFLPFFKSSVVYIHILLSRVNLLYSVNDIKIHTMERLLNFTHTHTQTGTCLHNRNELFYNFSYRA